MSVWGSQVNKQRRVQRAQEGTQQLRAQEFQEHVHTDHNDAALLMEVLDALEGVQKERAQGILVNNPGSLLSLSKPKSAGNDALTSPLTCPYALHAVIVPLVGSDYKAILDTMEDRNIRILSNCIDIVIKFPRPGNFVLSDIEKLKLEIKNRKATSVKTDYLGGIIPIERTLTESELIYKQRELRAKEVASQFVFNESRPDSDIWTETIEDLNKLSAAVDAAMLERGIDKSAPVHTASAEKEEEATDTEQPIWTINDLAKALNDNGIEASVKKIQGHISRKLKKPDEAAKIETWFVFKQGVLNAQGFRSQYFAMYQEMFTNIRPYNRKSKEVEKTTEAQTKETVVVQAPVAQPQKVDGLLGITALRTFLDGLVALLNEAKAELDAAKNNYNKTLSDLGQESDPEKRSELIGQLSQANTAVSNAQSKVDDIKKRLDDGNAALKAKEDADHAASVAQENMDKAKKELDFAKKAQKEADAIISAILANTNTPQK